MSIFDTLFGKAPVAAAPAPQQPQQQQQTTTPGNIPDSAATKSQAVSTTGTAPNGTVPVNDATKDGATKSGLDQFADIWDTSAQPGAQGQPLFNISQEKVMEAARKQDFIAQAATKEQLDKIMAGGAEAAQAMMEIMNTVAQNSFAQSALAATKLIDGALDKGGFARLSDVDTRVKNISVTNTLQQENPVFAHPAAQPMLDAVKNQLMVKYPNATPNELTAMAKNYLTEFVTAATPQQQAQTPQGNKGNRSEPNWGELFGIN